MGKKRVTKKSAPKRYTPEEKAKILQKTRHMGLNQAVRTSGVSTPTMVKWRQAAGLSKRRAKKTVVRKAKARARDNGAPVHWDPISLAEALLDLDEPTRIRLLELVEKINS